MVRPNKEYRVWRKTDGDPRTTQGHYVLANSPGGAIEAVKRKNERVSDFDVLLWKKGKSWLTMKRTAGAKRFIKTGKFRR